MLMQLFASERTVWNTSEVRGHFDYKNQVWISSGSDTASHSATNAPVGETTNPSTGRDDDDKSSTATWMDRNFW